MIPKQTTGISELEGKINSLASQKMNMAIMIDSGIVSDDNDDWKEVSDDDDGEYTYRAKVKFKKPFPSTPEIFLSITGISITKTSFWVESDKVSNEGFTIVLKSDVEEVDFCAVNWLAYLNQ